MPKLILASASTRRKELLSQLGLEFEVITCEINEIVNSYTPESTAEDISYKKAYWVSKKNIDDAVILAADTIVVYQGEILGKPKDKKDAKRMLSILNGNVHKVITGITLLDTVNKRHIKTHSSTKVFFKKLSDRKIENYIATGEYHDKAGAYGIQGYGACLVEKIEGCYFNVVGLPISKLADLLPKFNIKIF
jgi:septum formation protein